MQTIINTFIKQDNQHIMYNHTVYPTVNAAKSALMADIEYVEKNSDIQLLFTFIKGLTTHIQTIEPELKPLGFSDVVIRLNHENMQEKFKPLFTDYKYRRILKDMFKQHHVTYEHENKNDMYEPPKFKITITPGVTVPTDDECIMYGLQIVHDDMATNHTTGEQSHTLF